MIRRPVSVIGPTGQIGCMVRWGKWDTIGIWKEDVERTTPRLEIGREVSSVVWTVGGGSTRDTNWNLESWKDAPELRNHLDNITYGRCWWWGTRSLSSSARGWGNIAIETTKRCEDLLLQSKNWASGTRLLDSPIQNPLKSSNFTLGKKQGQETIIDLWF